MVAVKAVPSALKIPSSQQLELMDRSIAKEVDARLTAEARLQHMLESQYIASEARLHTYFETASQGIIVISRDLRMRLVNHRTEEMFGYPRAELIGKPLEMMWPERLREECGSARRREFEEQADQSVLEQTYRRKDGSEFQAEIARSFVDTEDGPLSFTMLTDITERRRAEQELARANQQLRSYLEAASQAIVAVSKDGGIVLVNRRVEELFGYPREELLGLGIEKLLPPRYRQAHAAHRLGFFANPRTRPMGPAMELSGLRKDGTEFPLEIGLSFVETEQGLLALGLISDVTERKRAADELVRAHDEAVRSNRDLEQFAYIASHDLQEPLRMVTAYLNLLDRRYRDTLDDDAREFIHYAVDGAERMKGLIQDLLKVARSNRQALNIEPSSTALMLKHALLNLKIAIEESGAVVTSDALPEVQADGALLTLVFQNLIGNAIKFRAAAPPRIHVSARHDAAQWIFSVRDNGIGIQPQHTERIFRIFERLNDPAKCACTGVGLAIAERIGARHGGRIWVDSRIGEGATFLFSLPGEQTKVSSVGLS
jgi:PAS domain S-box-containing protein